MYSLLALGVCPSITKKNHVGLFTPKYYMIMLKYISFFCLRLKAEKSLFEYGLSNLQTGMVLIYKFSFNKISEEINMPLTTLKAEDIFINIYLSDFPYQFLFGMVKAHQFHS